MNETERFRKIMREGEGGSLLELLHSGKVDVNAKDQEGITLLMDAARYGYAKIAHELLRRGANPHEKSNFDSTALIFAARGEYAGKPMESTLEDYAKIVTMLLEKNVDIDVKNWNGKDALSIAIFWGHRQIVEILEKEKTKEPHKTISGRRR